MSIPTPAFWNIGIAFSERKQPATIPMPADPTQQEIAWHLRGRNHNPNWALLVEPVFVANKPYVSHFVTSYEIELNRHDRNWEVIRTRSRGVYDTDDKIVAVLHLGTLNDAVNMTGLEDWIGRHPAARKDDNPSEHPEWYSATWVIRFLHYMRYTWRVNMFGRLATSDLHEFILQKWKQELRDYYSYGGPKARLFRLVMTA